MPQMSNNVKARKKIFFTWSNLPISTSSIRRYCGSEKKLFWQYGQSDNQRSYLRFSWYENNALTGRIASTDLRSRQRLWSSVMVRSDRYEFQFWFNRILVLLISVTSKMSTEFEQNFKWKMKIYISTRYSKTGPSIDSLVIIDDQDKYLSNT